MSLLTWQKIADQKEEVENQIKNIRNQIISSKLSDELGQIKFAKMFKPVTSRLDTQIEATKGLKDGDEMPNYEPPPPIDDDEDEMSNYKPPPPIDDDEDEIPNYEPPPPIDDDEDEIPNYEPPPPIELKRKKWGPSSINNAKQKELDNKRRDLAEERRQINSLLGKLIKSGENYIKSGNYQGASYDELLRQSEYLTKKLLKLKISC